MLIAHELCIYLLYNLGVIRIEQDSNVHARLNLAPFWNSSILWIFVKILHRWSLRTSEVVLGEFTVKNVQMEIDWQCQSACSVFAGTMV